MFQKIIFQLMLFIGYLLFAFMPLPAQEEAGEVIIISERVGPEIDPQEREKFKLFEEVRGFQSAVYLKLPDGRYFLKITYLDELTGEIKVKRILQLETAIKNRGYYIDHFEALQLRIEAEEKAGKVFILSNQVGPEIDAAEREQYKLFQDIKGFQSAVLIKLPDHQYILKIAYKDEQTGELKINRIQQTETSINDIRNMIDNLEKPKQKSGWDISKKWLCLSVGAGLPVIENGLQKFDGLGYELLMISLPRMYIALLVSGGYHELPENNAKGLHQEISFCTSSILLMLPITKSRKTNVFIGGGLGSVTMAHWEGGVNRSSTVDTDERLYALELGCKTRIPVLGFYTKFNWFHSKSIKNCTKLIIGVDFNLCL